jgi:hypothetical protein
MSGIRGRSLVLVETIWIYCERTSSWFRWMVVVPLMVTVGGPVGVGVVGVAALSVVEAAAAVVGVAGVAAIRSVFSTTLDAYWSRDRLTASSRIFCVTVALSVGDPCSRIC